MCRHFTRLFGIAIFGVCVRYLFAVDAELLCGRNYALSAAPADGSTSGESVSEHIICPLMTWGFVGWCTVQLAVLPSSHVFRLFQFASLLLPYMMDFSRYILRTRQVPFEETIIIYLLCKCAGRDERISMEFTSLLHRRLREYSIRYFPTDVMTRNASKLSKFT